MGETVKLAYVDQQHKDIDPNKSVYDVIAQGNENIRMGGRDVNARAYISRFTSLEPTKANFVEFFRVVSATVCSGFGIEIRRKRTFTRRTTNDI